MAEIDWEKEAVEKKVELFKCENIGYGHEHHDSSAEHLIEWGKSIEKRTLEGDKVKGLIEALNGALGLLEQEGDDADSITSAHDAIVDALAKFKQEVGNV